MWRAPARLLRGIGQPQPDVAKLFGQAIAHEILETLDLLQREEPIPAAILQVAPLRGPMAVLHLARSGIDVETELPKAQSAFDHLPVRIVPAREERIDRARVVQHRVLHSIASELVAITADQPVDGIAQQRDRNPVRRMIDTVPRGESPMARLHPALPGIEPVMRHAGFGPPVAHKPEGPVLDRGIGDLRDRAENGARRCDIQHRAVVLAAIVIAQQPRLAAIFLRSPQLSLDIGDGRAPLLQRALRRLFRGPSEIRLEQGVDRGGRGLHLRGEIGIGK
ncbi:hypothetical protein, partial [Thioclava sp.]|uniref:hypothetical protein n=1 Tax=Thioclava sp. TaxID=1933450 RepID=UPI003241DAB2